MRQRDIWGVAVVVAAIAGCIGYRRVYLEPRMWGALCAAAAAPAACVPRAGLIWLQQYYLLGVGSLVAGVWGFAYGGRFAAQVAAVVLGVAAIENYNATWGAIGAALGVWGWVRREGWG
jgi:hypothetical protein